MPTKRTPITTALALLALASIACAQGASTPAPKPADAKPAPGATAPAGANAPDAQADMEAYANASKPGPQHALLAPMVGEWDVVTRAWMDPTAAPIEMKAAVKKAWDYGGRFLKEEVSGTDPLGQAYTGVGYLGFDPGLKQYQGMWISSMSAAMIVYTGKAGADGKSFTFTGKESDPMGGAAIDFKMTVTIDSPDKHTLVFNYVIPGAGESKAFEMVHTRKK